MESRSIQPPAIACLISDIDLLQSTFPIRQRPRSSRTFLNQPPYARVQASVSATACQERIAQLRPLDYRYHLSCYGGNGSERGAQAANTMFAADASGHDVI